jgi:hypothetical protein
MQTPDSDLVLASAHIRVRVPFVLLALALSDLTSGSSRLAFVRLSLALELYRDPAPQELWDRFRDLHPRLAHAALQRVAGRRRAGRRRPSYNPFRDELPVHVDLRSATLSLPRAVSPHELEPAPAPAIHNASAAQGEAVRRRPPRRPPPAPTLGQAGPKAPLTAQRAALTNASRPADPHRTRNGLPSASSKGSP